MSLQVRVLPGANFLAQGAFPLDLLEHSGISADPGHLGHLKVAKHDRNIAISKTTCCATQLKRLLKNFGYMVPM